ncbi:MAG: response regulator [Reinekea sp.]|jgi:two-component system, CitB family, response regulator
MTTQQLKVLIIEDDPRNAEIQRRFLERIDGVELVGIAHSLASAQDLIEVFAPQLMLLDVHLPDGNGLEVLRQWRAEHKTFDVILITAAKEVDTVRSALHAGVFEYILKPLVYERLEESIERYRRHLLTLANLDQVGQRDVDNIITKPINTVEKERIPKGIDSLTLEKVIQLMQGSAAATADEVGTQIGASRTTARRYLEYMVTTGQLRAEVSYGSVGRPERRYCWVTKTGT